GQGELLVTPLQMARTYAAIGGDGYLYRPHLILARENAYGVIDKRLVRRENEKICSDKIRHFLQSALVDVVATEEGTGGLARIKGVDVAGKTGTAENASGEDHAWFIAYAPAEDPEVAVAVIIENAGHGGSVAAPIVGELLDTYFNWQEQETPSDTAEKVQP
ncbi:MAG TPA: penicillin-binding transpeptidase domain-containing protein, partial [Candidatus Krumholzibacteria bacterium]|nr:penicillin-binding transpeptidase domain-containing protein [Candidatus Krumholzibacteria bacterium]